ncbi:1-hydroxycarotenoid 3,4-desaturase CrtD [Psychroflexus tropicus]|uniref:1-hydroxycarotenoid 3,4-desaturase CrtD n=1 Tax=Psychroflexus tropicus TaxID=197345 RepID=UPI00036BA26B|nr:1-hydroxycarotenoid 3,4-desaturase CrtD [Psychroflexus tropicus]
MEPKAAVVGSGIAGIASALRLRAKGYHVDVFEQNTYTGGKLHSFKRGEFRFDYGPSLFTMPQYVDELFSLFGKEPKNYFRYKRKENICNYFWEDGQRFQVKADKTEFIEEASKAFNEPKENFTQYLNSTEEKYSLTSKLFLEKSLHKFDTYLSTDTLRAIFNLGKLHLDHSLDGVNQKYFKNPKLVQLFNRFATYNGSSPYKTPGIMSMIPHLEMNYGAFIPKQGMHDISQSLTQLAKDEGIVFHLDQKIDEILYEDNAVKGIKYNNQEEAYDTVVCNMDVYSAYNSLLKNLKPPKKTLDQERSSSALIFYWGVDKTYEELDLHNILFTEDYPKEFDHLFNKKYFMEDPTVYINITSKDVKEDAPEGSENWFVMVNAPTNCGQDWSKQTTYIREKIIAKINSCLGTKIQNHIRVEHVETPETIESATSSFQGSLYGTSSNNKFAAFLRHPNFSSKIKNLYFCGGSVHPGGGIPLCLLSAKIVSDLVPNA